MELFESDVEVPDEDTADTQASLDDAQYLLHAARRSTFRQETCQLDPSRAPKLKGQGMNNGSVTRVFGPITSESLENNGLRRSARSTRNDFAEDNGTMETDLDMWLKEHADGCLATIGVRPDQRGMDKLKTIVVIGCAGTSRLAPRQEKPMHQRTGKTGLGS